MIASR
jgi:hypothetical protein